MRQIANNVGLALGGIYNHFECKEDIFQAVFIENHPFLEMIPAIEDAQGDTIEALVRDAAEQMLEAISRKPDFLNLMFIEIVEFKSAHAHEMFESAFPRGLKIVQRMAEVEGNLRPIPPQMVMRAFIGLFFSYYLAEIILGDAAPPEFHEGAMDYQVDIFLNGILAEE
jgi:AcrR family transcriptional regulator